MSIHNMFLWRTDKNYLSIIIKYSPHLFHWNPKNWDTRSIAVIIRKFEEGGFNSWERVQKLQVEWQTV